MKSNERGAGTLRIGRMLFFLPHLCELGMLLLVVKGSMVVFVLAFTLSFICSNTRRHFYRAGSPGWRHVRRLYRTGEFDEKVAKLHHLSLGVALYVLKNSELSSHSISQLGSCGVPG